MKNWYLLGVIAFLFSCESADSDRMCASYPEGQAIPTKINITASRISSAFLQDPLSCVALNPQEDKVKYQLSEFQFGSGDHQKKPGFNGFFTDYIQCDPVDPTPGISFKVSGKSFSFSPSYLRGIAPSTPGTYVYRILIENFEQGIASVWVEELNIDSDGCDDQAVYSK
jgi:hypothetical protein